MVTVCTGTQKGGDICRALTLSPQPQHTLLLPGHRCGLCWVPPRTAGSARIPLDGPACPSQQPTPPWPSHPLRPHLPPSSSPQLAWQPTPSPTGSPLSHLSTSTPASLLPARPGLSRRMYVPPGRNFRNRREIPAMPSPAARTAGMCAGMESHGPGVSRAPRTRHI